jgi:MYXO-CTERM domain-containing protein
VRGRGPLLAGALALLAAGAAHGFSISEPRMRWPSGSFGVLADFALSGNATSPSGTTWDDAFEDAAERWNAATPLVDVAVTKGALEDPCDEGDGVNGAGFRADVCGEAFGTQTVAVALRLYSSGGLVEEGNVVFKSTATWDVYDGPLQASTADFRRVAIHELGHLLGLDHENAVPSIMKPVSDDHYLPQADDVAGIEAIYDLDCPILVGAGAGQRSGTLNAEDCLDTEFEIVEPDLPSNPPLEINSFVDLYRVSMPSGGLLAATVDTAGAFNPIVQILDSGSLLVQRAAGVNPAHAPASASAVVPPGVYVVAVRSVFAGEGGPYTLQLVPEPGAGAGGAVALAVLAALAQRRRRATV